jgi:hypothetical protein
MEPVGLRAQAPDVLGTLSQILGIRQLQQQVRGATAQAQMSEQDAAQRQALAGHDFKRYLGRDGTFDLNLMAVDPELRQAAGDQFLDVLTRAADQKQAQLTTRATLNNLRNDQLEAMNQILGSLRGDPDVVEDNDAGRQKLNAALIKFGEIYGEDALPVLETTANLIRSTPRGQMDTLMASLQRQNMDAAQQKLATQDPRYVNTGRQLVATNPDLQPGIPESMQLTLPPTATIVQDAAGRQYVLDPATNRPLPIGGGSPTGRAAPAPTEAPTAPIGGFIQPEYQGQERDVAAYQDQVRTIRESADQAPMQRDVFKKILKLSEETSTGPLVKFLQETKIGGQVFGDNYQQLAKYLERNAISAMQAMGGGASDARLEAAVAATGSPGFNKEALQEVTRFNYAANSALEAYRKGMDRAIGTDRPDYLRLPEFRAAWAENFDINAFLLENAIADGDKKTQEKILKSLTPDQAAQLQQRIRNLDALTETGRLP